ncbi:hypothetical protein OH77DRAFT_1447400 [Trametes cingulata]|nr:hypothetical protein OH77DRAFT_1447400 [Trametes cingulata]
MIARQDHLSRWVMASPTEKAVKEVMLYSAGPWLFNSDLEVGNFLPKGEAAESNVAESRLQTTPNHLCQLSYALGTRGDQTFFDAQAGMERYLRQVAGFNKANKPRREWQDGVHGTKDYFVLSSQIFVKRSFARKRGQTDVPYTPHKWITKATPPESDYMPNPNRPRFFELRDGALHRIDNIARGDLVWISFTAEFILRTSTWSTTFTPYEIVRVGRLALELLDSGSQLAVVDTSPAQGLQVGLKVVMNDDFPMYVSETPAEKLTAGRGHITPKVAKVAETSERGESESPISDWEPTPPPEALVADATQGSHQLARDASPRRELSRTGTIDSAPTGTHNRPSPSHASTEKTNHSTESLTQSESSAATGEGEDDDNPLLNDAPVPRGRKRRADDEGSSMELRRRPARVAAV